MLCPRCQKEYLSLPHRTCLHLLGAKSEFETMHRRFTGQGVAYELICSACAGGGTASRAHVCAGCFRHLQRFFIEEPNIGWPEVLTRSAGLSFAHRDVTLPELSGTSLVAIHPMPGQDPAWLGLTAARELVRLDLDQLGARRLGRLSDDRIDITKAVALAVDQEGRFAAAAATFGLHGEVVDLETGRPTMALHREPYYEEHCAYPLAFARQDGRSLLIHATHWNRLEIHDPATGESVVERPAVAWDGPGTKHYLDYFYSGLLVSPDQRWIATNGWHWQPWGSVYAWSLTDWVQQNVWESEDGVSRRELCARDSYWGGPICWVGPSTVAVFGFGDTEATLIPAVRLFDVTTGEQLRWFAGPEGELVYAEGLLYAFSQTAGTSVWDLETGERLHQDLAFCPTAYHGGTGQFITPMDGGRFRISRLVK